MSSDLDTIKGIFDKRGIGYTLLPLGAPSGREGADGPILRFADGDAGFDGYCGFLGMLRFDKDGALIGTGAWE